MITIIIIIEITQPNTLKNMKIIVWNLKGGQGKTVLSLAIAMLEGAYVITNDRHSPIDEVIGEDRGLRLKADDPLPSVPAEIDLIYDFGGFPDVRTIEAAKNADYIVVPIIYESPLEMQVTLNALREIEAYNKNIVVVVNKAKPNDLERTESVLKDFGFNYPIFEIKQSTVFSKAVENKKSLQELVDENPLWRIPYSKPLKQVKTLISHIS